MSVPDANGHDHDEPRQPGLSVFSLTMKPPCLLQDLPLDCERGYPAPFAIQQLMMCRKLPSQNGSDPPAVAKGEQRTACVPLPDVAEALHHPDAKDDVPVDLLEALGPELVIRRGHGYQAVGQSSARRSICTSP